MELTDLTRSMRKRLNENQLDYGAKCGCMEFVGHVYRGVLS